MRNIKIMVLFDRVVLCESLVLMISVIIRALLVAYPVEVMVM